MISSRSTPPDLFSVTQWQLGMANGVFFPVPIPEEYNELGESLKVSVEKAIAESGVNGMDQRGNKATPWLLNRIVQLSHGASIKSSMCIPVEWLLAIFLTFCWVKRY